MGDQDSSDDEGYGESLASFNYNAKSMAKPMVSKGGAVTRLSKDMKNVNI